MSDEIDVGEAVFQAALEGHRKGFKTAFGEVERILDRYKRDPSRAVAELRKFAEAIND